MLSLAGRLLGVAEGPARVCSRGNRVFSRRPVRVHLKGAAEEVEETVRRYEDVVAGNTGKGQQRSEHHEQKAETAAPTDLDALLRKRIYFKLLSDAGDYERKLLENMKSHKYRSQHQLFVAEGHRVIREALEHGAMPLALYFTRLRLLAALKAEPSKLKVEDVHTLSDLPLFKTPYKTLQTWSSVTTSPGIVGVFKIPNTIEPASQPSTTSTTTTSLPLTLVLDELREPGNLGVILRTAAAAGVRQVLLMKGCCDPWEAKVVRAGCGAHFRLRLTTKLTWERLGSHIPEETQIFLADVGRGEDVLGAVEEEEEEEGEAVTTKKGEVKDRSSSDTWEGSVYELDEEGNKVLVDHSYNDPQHLELYRRVSLPTLSYDRLRMARAEDGAVLVVGGEVGISTAAKKFVADNFGSKVTVPLANGMDSLNVGVASGVILYEMQRQLHEMETKRLWKARHESGG